MSRGPVIGLPTEGYGETEDRGVIHLLLWFVCYALLHAIIMHAIDFVL